MSRQGDFTNQLGEVSLLDFKPSPSVPFPNNGLFEIREEFPSFLEIFPLALK